jgi:hypothetical protein
MLGATNPINAAPVNSAPPLIKLRRDISVAVVSIVEAPKCDSNPFLSLMTVSPFDKNKKGAQPLNFFDKKE